MEMRKAKKNGVIKDGEFFQAIVAPGKRLKNEKSPQGGRKSKRSDRLRTKGKRTSHFQGLLWGGMKRPKLWKPKETMT